MFATVAVDVEARIVELVEAHRAELEALVDAELDRALDRLVAERLVARNGARVVELVNPTGLPAPASVAKPASTSHASSAGASSRACLEP